MLTIFPANSRVFGAGVWWNQNQARPSRSIVFVHVRLRRSASLKLVELMSRSLSALDRSIAPKVARPALEPTTLNHRVPGSSPGAPTKHFKHLAEIFAASRLAYLMVEHGHSPLKLVSGTAMFGCKVARPEPSLRRALK
jgi:hypothetical protein